ncbi:MAG: FlgD immunoglobulin-like domain containing protein [Candidatus Eisenbacteria bacterium]
MRGWRMFVVITLTCLLAGIAWSQPSPVFQTLVKEGDIVPGVGAVTRIDNLSVANGGVWFVEADTDNPNADIDVVLLRNGSLYLQEGQPLPLPAGSSLDSFDSMRFANDGRASHNFFLSGTSGTGDDSGVYLDTALVIQESDISTATAFSPGTAYIGFFGTYFNDASQILIVASVEDTAIASTVDRALVIADVDNNGNLVSETVIAKEGDILPGQTERITDFGTGEHQTSWNNDGEAFYFADLEGPTDRDGVVYKNTGLVAQEGMASPEAGRAYELLSGRSLDINNGGEYAFKANLDGSTTDDEVIVKGNSILVREGSLIADIAPYQITATGTASGPVQIDDNGRVLWYGDWDDPNTDYDTGLFLDSTLVVQEGVTAVDGNVIDVIYSGQDAFMMSDDGEYVIFEVDFVGGINAAVMMRLSDPTDVAEAGGLVAPLVLRALPNPFAAETAVRFGLTKREDVDLRIFDIRGRLVTTLASGEKPAGFHDLTWSGRDDRGRSVPSGVYFLRLKAGGDEVTSRIVRMR